MIRKRNGLVVGLVALIVLMIGALYTVQARHNATINKLKSDNAALRAEVKNKTDMLRAERSKVDILTNYTFKEGPIGASLKSQSSAKAQQIAYKKPVAKKKVVKKKKRYTKRKYKNRRLRVSRGADRVHPYAAQIKAAGATYWSDPAELEALVWISARECMKPGGVSPNGKYKGLFQLGSPPSWMVLGDAASETRAGCEYIKRRYGTPLKAKAFKMSHGWY